MNSSWLLGTLIAMLCMFAFGIFMARELGLAKPYEVTQLRIQVGLIEWQCRKPVKDTAK